MSLTPFSDAVLFFRKYLVRPAPPPRLFNITEIVPSLLVVVLIVVHPIVLPCCRRLSRRHPVRPTTMKSNKRNNTHTTTATTTTTWIPLNVIRRHVDIVSARTCRPVTLLRCYGVASQIPSNAYAGSQKKTRRRCLVCSSSYHPDCCENAAT